VIWVHRKSLSRARLEPIFMLAESDGEGPLVLKAGFDAAYDWSSEIGHWVWNTVLGVSSWSNLLERFIENNDQERFLPKHTLQQTRAAATLMFTLPGTVSRKTT